MLLQSVYDASVVAGKRNNALLFDLRVDLLQAHCILRKFLPR